MNTKLLAIIFFTLVIIGGAFMVDTYNSIVTKDEAVTTAWSQVENQYQRRADLVPNLVETVKGVAAFEQDTFTAVTEARAAALKTEVDINNVEEIAEFAERQQGLSQALSRLLMITENYPQLQATESFQDLQVQLEGTENRIAVARMDYNQAVQTYNVTVRSFPSNVTASLFGFEKAAQFESVEGSEFSPEVDFGNE